MGVPRAVAPEIAGGMPAEIVLAEIR